MPHKDIEQMSAQEGSQEVQVRRRVLQGMLGGTLIGAGGLVGVEGLAIGNYGQMMAGAVMAVCGGIIGREAFVN